MENPTEDLVQKRNQIAKFIDHTILRPEATPLDIEKACEEARECRFLDRLC